MKAYYGYEMVDGQIHIKESEAEKIRMLYDKYLEGLSIVNAGVAAGIDKYHPYLGRVLSNPVYMGNETYPKIIHSEIFDKVQQRRRKVQHQFGRNFPIKEKGFEVPTQFVWKATELKPINDPYEYANRLYQQIEVIQ